MSSPKQTSPNTIEQVATVKVCGKEQKYSSAEPGQGRPGSHCGEENVAVSLPEKEIGKRFQRGQRHSRKRLPPAWQALSKEHE
jgi:hypothetical protein